jgi:hypothetical protein
MRKGTNNPQNDSGFGFSRVIRVLTFKRRQKAAGRTTAQEAGFAKWEQTYWGRLFIKSM